MAYTNTDFKTKKDLKAAIAGGKKVYCHQPGGLYPLGVGRISLEGPHFPRPHTWYATVMVDQDGLVTKFIA